MVELKGSKTEANLLAAFAGESQARNKYTYYADQARKEGYNQIADLFLETAENEREHAKLWFKALHGGTVPKTLENLKDAAGGESYEYNEMYKNFAATAKSEGFNEIAELFLAVGEIENVHDKRYRELYDSVQAGKVFKKDCAAIWKCRNCGHIHVGAEAPKICPVCSHPQAYFEVQAHNW
ncbi:MAG: rubrerythrin family protein [Candidatus Methanoplasma sp.]|jgi:rubrerythrin|nr:rubrerythrin family protein [Candidatus Methanoplasma sp.]